MRKWMVIVSIWSLSALEVLAMMAIWLRTGVEPRDTVAINEVVKTLEADWGHLDTHVNPTTLEYVVLDQEGNVCFRTGEHLSESIHAAIVHGDTILDVWPRTPGQPGSPGQEAGQAQADVPGRQGTEPVVTDGLAGNGPKVIIYNTAYDAFLDQRRKGMAGMGILLLVQGVVVTGYFLYLEKALVTPFRKLQGFARRVAAGNLEVPLSMDRGNVFGAFTESFDIMREELKKARIAQAQADESKKELVAKLSHDIRTPVASIKAVAEVGEAVADSGRDRESYHQIIRKADQINALVTNLFTATLEEMTQLTVTPSDIESARLWELLDNADYLHRGRRPEIPACLVSADGFRLQQVFDNIFANSYKYAGTGIRIFVEREEPYLGILVEDEGGGVPEEELPFLKEKCRRGSNAQGIDGAGLGLFISDFLMREMQGRLTVENGKRGLRVGVWILLSGRPGR